MSTRTTPAETTYAAPQLDSPQRSVRGEGLDGSGRDGRYSHGEVRVVRHAGQEVDQRLGAARQRRVTATQGLSDAATALFVFLATLQVATAGEYGRHREAQVRHHRAQTTGDLAGVRRLATRRWVGREAWLGTVGLLVLADFAFFFRLWSDIEDADGLASGASLQAALYALITPVVTAVTLGALGRVAAAGVRHGGELDPRQRRRLVVIAPVAVIVPVVVLFAVRQRIQMLTSEVGAADVSPWMMMLIFLLLPLGLFVVELLRNDEEVALHGLRSSDWAESAAFATEKLREAAVLHRAWVEAHLALQDLLSATIQAIREPLNAAGDLLAHEWAMNGSNDDYVTALGTKVVIRGTSAPEGVTWCGLAHLAGDLDRLLAGDALPIDASEIAAMEQSLRAHEPPPIESVLERVRATVTADDPTGEPISFSVPSASVTALRPTPVTTDEDGQATPQGEASA